LNFPCYETPKNAIKKIKDKINKKERKVSDYFCFWGKCTPLLSFLFHGAPKEQRGAVRKKKRRT
jgi:hypothetical protein